MPHTASTAPTAAPARPSTIDSVSNNTRMRPGVAPRARRMLTSRYRPLAFASTRFAVLPQTASHNTSITACSTTSAVAIIRCGPRGLSQNASTDAVMVLLVSGYVCASSRITVSTSRCASSPDAPGASRPITENPRVRLERRGSEPATTTGPIVAGINTSKLSPSTGP